MFIFFLNNPTALHTWNEITNKADKATSIAINLTAWMTRVEGKHQKVML